MRKPILIIVLILIAAGAVYYFGFYHKGLSLEKNLPTGLGVANPAAVFCQEQGGVSQIQTFLSGQRGFCLFPDGSRCDEWDFYRGDCAQGQLKIEILQAGAGALVDEGDVAVVHYTGWLTDGTKFDSSLDRGQPFSFELGAGQVIAGWEQGVLGMQKGEKRKLTIAPALAYGESGVSGFIPPRATLVFEVELLEIK